MRETCGKGVMGMGKGRSCRRTPEENAVHNEAVRLRKMSDAELVAMLREQQTDVRTTFARIDVVKQLITELCAGECKGVSEIAASRIKAYAERRGFI